MIEELSACMDDLKAVLDKHGISAAVVAIAIESDDGLESGEAHFGSGPNVVALLREAVEQIETDCQK